MGRRRVDTAFEICWVNAARQLRLNRRSLSWELAYDSDDDPPDMLMPR